MLHWGLLGTLTAETPMPQVLYNLFEWPLQKGSRLAIIGISNTHDLPDKFLPRIVRRVTNSAANWNFKSRMILCA